MSDSKPAQPKKKKNYSELTESQLEWTHWVYQWLSVQILQAYYVLWHRLKVYGKENCPRQWQPFVVAANHISNLDPPLVSVALNYRPISYMAKIELFQTPLLRLYNWAMSAFAVNRDKLEISTVKTAHKVLKHGKWALGIFPEGSRQSGEAMKEAKKGVAYFAKACKVDVIPVGIYHGKQGLRVCVGKPIPSNGVDMDTLAENIRVAILNLVNEAAAKP